MRSVIASNRPNYWGGQVGRDFERAFAEWTGTDHAVAVTNGTLALDLALHALGIGERNGGSAKDEVIVTPRTFIASASTVVLAGARPVFADVDLDSGNISAETAAKVLTNNTRAIIPVHLGGWPVEMEAINSIANGHGLKVIEDCAQAHGAQIDGRAVGSWGDVGAWSFCQDKIMTTGGEGGMVTTNDPDLWSAMWSYKDHGKDWEAVYERDHPPGYRYVHDGFGTNWRMLEMQAAIGLIQLGRMPGWTQRRTAIAMQLREVLGRYPGAFRCPLPREGITHAYYRYYAYFRPDGLRNGWDRDRVIAEMASQGIPVMHGTCSEVYLERAFEGTGYRPAQRLANARELGETSVMFLIHPALNEDHLQSICDAIDGVLKNACR